MTLTQLEYVLAIHRAGSFTAAAKECHVTQPTLSMQVQQLERELGIVIFDRAKTPVQLTEQGRMVIERAKSILTEAKLLTDEVRDAKQEVKGKFRLGIIPTVAPYVLPLFLESFSKKYPDVQLIIDEKPTGTLLVDLDRDEVDAALMAPTASMSPSLVSRTLYYEPFLVFVAPDHPLHKKRQIASRELSSKGLWLIGEGHCLREQTMEVCKDGGAQARVLDNVDFASGGLETIRNLIRQCSGYTLMPYLATLTLPPKDRELYIRTFQKPTPTRKISLIAARAPFKRAIRDKLCEEILGALPMEVPTTEKGLDVIELK